MKKKILTIMPYILGLIYLAYCLLHVEMWVKSHTEHVLFVFLPWAVAAILAIVFIIMSLVKKRMYDFCLPVFIFVIGWVIQVVASSIPCCVGG